MQNETVPFLAPKINTGTQEKEEKQKVWIEPMTIGKVY